MATKTAAKAANTKVEETTPEVTLHLTKDLADLFGTDAKTLRRFLRRNLTPESLPGKGGRYRIPSTELEALKARFDASASTKVTEIKFKGDSED